MSEADAFDLVILAGTVAGLVRALRSWGQWASAFGAVGFWVYHLGLGSLNVGQRDFVMCLPLAWMIAMAIEHERTGPAARAGRVGLLPRPGDLDEADRPPAGSRAAGARLAWRRHPPVGTRVRGARAQPGVSVGIAAWLASRGGIGPFVQNVWPLVAHCGEPRPRAVRGADQGQPLRPIPRTLGRPRAASRFWQTATARRRAPGRCSPLRPIRCCTTSCRRRAGSITSIPPRWSRSPSARRAWGGPRPSPRRPGGGPPGGLRPGPSSRSSTARPLRPGGPGVARQRARGRWSSSSHH
mgnify:CR=1 FL=1